MNPPDAPPATGSVVRVGAGTVRLRVRGSRGDAASPVAAGGRPSRYGRWRAMTLGSVYLLMGVHLAHWKLNGTTLAPLELNEVMHTLELGIVTAGFIFMAVAVVATLIFGRFFCSWGCHILALEDLCAWLLEKAGIRPKPVRSRVLLLVPVVALLYMFVWPHVVRIAAGRPAPRIRFLTDEDGWASFLTTDYWRNLPDPWIAALTFAVCGFAIVYFLGSRSFCRYACPYGVAFALADRVAPGRIKLTGQCEQCGHCTAACSSHVRVHEEIARYGRVVDTGCLKDLDCVSACPHDAISFGFGRPGLLSSFRPARGRLRYDFSLGEDALMAAVFVACILVFRGLYNAVPFLMTLGLAAIAAYGAVLALRLARRPNVRLNQFQLVRSGRLTRSGRVFTVLVALFIAFAAHSGFIRYHEWRGERLYLAARAAETPAPATLDAAAAHLSACARWGLFRPTLLDERLADVHLMRSDPARAVPHLEAVVAARPRDLEARLALAKTYAAAGRPAEGAAEAQRLLHVAAASAPPAAADKRQRALEWQAEAHQLLAQWSVQAGRLDEAEARLREVVALLPESAAAHNNLGLLLAETGRPDEAAGQFERAVALRPDLAQPHYNLGRLAELAGDEAGAALHFAEAARLDPAFAGGSGGSGGSS